MDITPSALEGEFSLATAATRLDWLRRRDNGDTAVNTVVDTDDWSSFRTADTSLDLHESLELLALGEVLARKAHGSQLIGIRAALRSGAGWEQIAAALDRTPAEAFDAYLQLVEEEGLDAAARDSARELAGARPSG